MGRFKVKGTRYIALTIVIILTISSLAMAVDGLLNSKNTKTNSNQNPIDLNKDDNLICEEISNMTGFTKEEIKELKTPERTWNDVLELLKDKKKTKNPDESRSNTLLESGSDEEAIKKLKSEGYAEQDIIEAKMLVERVSFQLKEIVGEEEPIEPTGSEDNDNLANKEDDVEAYKELMNKIDNKVAINLLVKLKKEFNTYEKVFDEYLYALQIDIDFQKYLTNKKQYEKEKQEKSIGVDESSIITLEKIESKSLEKIQKQNKEKKNEDASNKKEVSSIEEKIKNKDDLPQISTPNVEDIRPANPAEETMKEIEALRNGVLNIEDSKEDLSVYEQ